MLVQVRSALGPQGLMEEAWPSKKPSGPRRAKVTRPISTRFSRSGPTPAEIQSLEDQLPAAISRKCPQLRSNVWARSLLEDGGIESQPVPLLLRIVSVKTGGVEKACSAFDHYAALGYDIVVLQELCMVSRKQQSLRAMAAFAATAVFSVAPTKPKDIPSAQVVLR